MRSIPLIGLCLVIATAGHAQMADQDGPPRFERLDADADGFISREEAERARENGFARLDSNGDGVITTQEIIARQQIMQMRSELWQARLALAAAQMDTDGDGAITPEEFAARQPVFDMADLDGDDRISQDEAGEMRGRLRAVRP